MPTTSLSDEAVRKVAELARLRLTEKEVAEIGQQLSAVLANFNELQAVDTTGVEPLLTPSDITLNLREDEPRETSTREAFMRNAPSRSGNLFKVPPVVGS
jgi:aspartyl-tRNA(Asn)/glutamyl-tRNA(Gln) amidotransferase subunit C